MCEMVSGYHILLIEEPCLKWSVVIIQHTLFLNDSVMRHTKIYIIIINKANHI